MGKKGKRKPKSKRGEPQLPRQEGGDGPSKRFEGLVKGGGYRSSPHSRNLYKPGLDFEMLATKFPELGKYVIKTEGGKVKIDFKDNKSLCVLTQTFAKRDFGLDIVLPHDKMTPVLPMRYNYLLWIEDLLEMWPPETKADIVNGIDIGANASCLYALIAAKKNNWKMLTSEYDNKIYSFAERNISTNGLQSLVTVKKVSDSTYLDGVIDPNVSFYDFCMISPPFLCNKDAQVSLGKVNGQLLPIRSLTGKVAEIMAAGGEANFMIDYVKESEKFKTKIKMFTFMVGRKSTVDKIGPVLLEMVGDDYVVSEVFVHGPNHSFGIAWTFDKNMKMKNETRLNFHARRPLKSAVQHTMSNINMHDAFSQIIAVFDNFMVNYKVVEQTNDKYCLELNSFYEFWSKNGQQKAQDWKRKQNSEGEPSCKNPRLDNSQNVEIAAPTLAICPQKPDSDVNSETDVNPNLTVQRSPISVENFSRTYHSGDTVAINAQLNIINESTNNVSIELIPTGGTAGWSGAQLVVDFIFDQLKRPKCYNN